MKRTPIPAYAIGSWLFLLGSLLFSVDASLALAEGWSWRGGIYGVACLCFTVGCLYFVLDAHSR